MTISQFFRFREPKTHVNTTNQTANSPDEKKKFIFEKKFVDTLPIKWTRVSECLLSVSENFFFLPAVTAGPLLHQLCRFRTTILAETGELIHSYKPLTRSLGVNIYRDYLS